jgi:hypothetical protein
MAAEKESESLPALFVFCLLFFYQFKAAVFDAEMRDFLRQQMELL